MGNYFEVWGPFELPRNTEKMRPRVKELLAESEYNDGVDCAIGCYSFCLQHGKTIKPWYVGMTVARAGLLSEAFQEHKLENYRNVLDTRRGKPLIFFFALLTDEGRFAFGSSHRQKILWLEDTLMGMAFSRNPEILNIKGMRWRREIVVNGLMGEKVRGRPHQGVVQARRAFLGD